MINFWSVVLIFCLSISFLGANPALAQGDLNAQLRMAVCAQNWDGAIFVVDRMVPLVADQGQLINYRQQLQNLQSVNFRQANWACTPNQPIPALPQNIPPNLADGSNPANSSPNGNPSSANPFNTAFTPGASPRSRRSSDVDFWDGFLDIADPETESIARSLGQERLRQYATSVCSTLERGGRIRDVPSIATGNILTTPEFELTLQEASISTYCPTQIDKLE
jgi:RNA polymerase subunit RPABC4/transcription elongation factor Spt4